MELTNTDEPVERDWPRWHDAYHNVVTGFYVWWSRRDFLLFWSDAYTDGSGKAQDLPVIGLDFDRAYFLDSRESARS